MAVDAEAVETYDNLVIREDLRQQYYMISPEEVPFQTLIGVGEAATSTYKEWPVVDLAAPEDDNRVIEGDDAPATDAGTLAKRQGNYTQISDKKVVVSHTSEAVDAAASNVQRLSEQISLKIRELKRDMEVMLLSNVAANPGASGTARVMAGFPAFLRSNTFAGGGGADPTTSGAGDNGYPNAPATAGTPTDLTEGDFNAAIEAAWEAGGNPTVAMVNSKNKRLISETFTGTSTRYKDAVSRELVNAIDIYDSDFGQVSVIPNRFQPWLNPPTNTSAAVYFIDSEFANISFLETMRQKPLAETGHSRKRLVRTEYTLCVGNEAAHSAIRDTRNVYPT